MYSLGRSKILQYRSDHYMNLIKNSVRVFSESVLLFSYSVRQRKRKKKLKLVQNTGVIKILAQVVFVHYLRESMLDFWIIREHFVQFFWLCYWSVEATNPTHWSNWHCNTFFVRVNSRQDSFRCVHPQIFIVGSDRRNSVKISDWRAFSLLETVTGSLISQLLVLYTSSVNSSYVLKPK